MMLMVAYSASVGGIGSPVGTPPNLIGIAMIEKFTHVKIHFFTWMAFAFPLLVIMLVFLFILMYFLHKPELKNISGSHDYIISERKMLGKWKRGEINSLLAFAITVLLWVLPGILSIIYGKDAVVTKLYSNILPEGIVAVIGAVLLFILPVNFREREFTIKWKDAVKINWGTLILFGGGLSLGNLMFETKLAEAIGLSLTGLAGSGSVWILTLTAIYISILASEAASNTASANMVIPVMISVSVAAGLNPVPPAIGATLGASWGFMLPVSTPPNAIVYGTGMVPIRKMVRAGIIFDIIGGLIIWIGLRIMLPLLNMA
jgi:sodium-dependent dicarboxylate transporter 2/3/5